MRFGIRGRPAWRVPRRAWAAGVLAVFVGVAACGGDDKDAGGPDDTGDTADTGDAGCTDGTSWYTDADGDGHGDPKTLVEACDPPKGAVALGDDCDDDEARAYPGNPEVCDYVDNDCDDEVDEPDATDASTWYEDADHDEHGNPKVSVTSCTGPSGFSATADDCDDLDPESYPGAPEVCGDGIDQDCVDGDLACT